MQQALCLCTPIPERANSVREVLLLWEEACKSEVGEFKLPILRNEYIAGLEVTMEDVVSMAECDGLQHLFHEGFC